MPALSLAVAIWVLACLNFPFWRALWQAVGGWDLARAGHVLTLPLAVLAWVWLVLELLTWGRFARPVLALVLILSAAAGYFMHTYGVVFDRSMIANLIETHPAEALELLGWRLWTWVALFGGLPVLVLWRIRPRREGWLRHLLSKGAWLAAIAGVLMLLVAPWFQSYASLVRNHRDLRLQLVPTNFLAAAHGYARKRLAVSRELQRVGTDARRTALSTTGKPTLLVLVIGETARAANFSINGYPRATNPELAAQAELISLRQVHSCGTSTAVSLPCMFLDAGRAGYSDGQARWRESLLDVLQHAGVAVLWRENNSGCKGVCERVPTEDLSALHVPGLCNSEECWDEILLHGLQERIDALDHDAVVVLHMKGSHGPAYHLRVPTAYEYFKPVCRSSELGRCPREQLVNAYDNTLRYTDHVLARSIGLLQRNSARFDSALIYVSDHGESLGEYGVYLHGLPYGMAPEEQTHVPMLLWLPAATQRHAGMDADCLRNRRDEAYSHDHLYHSVLGLLRVQTQVYRPERDLFRPCMRIAAALG